MSNTKPGPLSPERSSARTSIRKAHRKRSAGDADTKRAKEEREKSEDGAVVAKLEREAAANYREAVDLYDMAIKRLESIRLTDPGANDDLIEAYGSRGGVLRRLNRISDALASYEAGADIERKTHHTSTYNRANYFRHAILVGSQTLSDVIADIKTVKDTLEALVKDEEAAGQAWNWGDLADCRALLGDLDGAADAYRKFVEKASTSSPKKALQMLQELASALRKSNDPQAERIEDAVEELKGQLVS